MSNDRRLLLVLRPFTGLFVLAMVASALAALFDGVTIVVLIPFLKQLFGTAGPLTSGNTAIEETLARVLAPALAGLTPARASVAIMGILLGALLIKNIFVYVHSQTSVRVQEGVVRDLRSRLFGHVLHVDLAFFQSSQGDSQPQ